LRRRAQASRDEIVRGGDELVVRPQTRRAWKVSHDAVIFHVTPRSLSMNAEKYTAGISTAHLVMSRAPTALLVLLCGIAGTAAAAWAATPTEDVPSVSVKYDPRSLNTDEGAKAVYRHLVKAAEAVCPGVNTGSLVASAAVLQCRQEAVARAIRQINDPRLAALGDRSTKTG